DGSAVQARAVVLGVGLRPAVPPIPGLAEAGFVDNEGALGLRALPRRLAVIGGGPIGCEFAQIFARFGVAVTVVEALGRLLPPEEPEAGAALREVFTGEGIAVRLDARVSSVSASGAVKRISFEAGPDLEVDEILVASGRRLEGEALGLDAAGIRWTPKGVEVDDTLRTSQPWAFAAGDAVGGPLFTHVASEMGRVAGLNAALGAGERLDTRVLPRVTFTDPEVASVGISEAAARAQGLDVRVGLAPLAEAEKAQIDGITAGHVKVVANAATGELLGCQVVAEEAGAMIHEAVAMMAARSPVGLLAGTMHAYPTLSELMRSAFAEAAG
ncbi:MAG: dihydrolipoyl dehydrogenase family protein, partial [Candidatus Dormibacterales bacterium]